MDIKTFLIHIMALHREQVTALPWKDIMVLLRVMALHREEALIIKFVPIVMELAMLIVTFAKVLES